MAKKPYAQAIDNLVNAFSEDLQRIVNDARNAVTGILLDRLSITDGVIAKTRSNQRVLQSIADLFKREMRRAGYPALLNAFVRSWNGQLGYFQDTLDLIGEQIGRDLTVEFGKRDLDFFAQRREATVQMLDSVVLQAAQTAQRTALFSIGGVRAKDLVPAIAAKLDATVPQAQTIADTALSTYYRTIAARGYRMVEQDLPDSIPALYKYGGPDDKLTRPFCRARLAETRAGKLWTLAEINAMSNGQLPNVFLTCGGFNCRHNWIMVLRTNEPAD